MPAGSGFAALTAEHGFEPATSENWELPLVVSEIETGPASGPGPVLVIVSVPAMGGLTTSRVDMSDCDRWRTSGFGATRIEGGMGVAVSVGIAVAVFVAVGVSVLVLVAVGITVNVGVAVLVGVKVRVDVLVGVLVAVLVGV